MTREEAIAHLQLHGYQLSRGMHRWAAIWSPERQEGRLAKKFARGWDVRRIISALAIANHVPGSWDLVDAELALVFVNPLPPKYVHGNPLGQRGYIAPPGVGW